MTIEALAVGILFTFLIVLVGIVVLAGLQVLSIRDVNKLSASLAAIETNVYTLVNDVSHELHGGSHDDVREIWKSADGKYTADSFEELLEKMINDPDTPLSVDEIESIKNIFNKILGGMDDPSDDAEPWK